jgi:hypothetical protein
MPLTYDELPLDESFPRDYEIEWLVDMPNSPSLKPHYLDPGPHGDGSGPILRVTTKDGTKFIAVIGGDMHSLRLATWPSPAHFFALPSAVLVDTAEPARSRKLEGFEGHCVHYAVSLPDHGMELIGHCCAIYGYNADGLAWALEDAFCCDDPIIDVAGDDLVLVAHNHSEDPGDTPSRKVFDLLTGSRKS